MTCQNLKEGSREQSVGFVRRARRPWPHRDRHPGTGTVVWLLPRSVVGVPPSGALNSLMTDEARTLSACRRDSSNRFGAG